MSEVNAKDVRAWAKAQGKQVGAKGRLSQALIDEYESYQRTLPGSSQPGPSDVPDDLHNLPDDGPTE